MIMRRITWSLIIIALLTLLALNFQPLAQAQPHGSYALRLPLIIRSEFAGWTLEPGWTIVEGAGHQLAHVMINNPALAHLTSPAYPLNGSTVSASVLVRVASILGHSGLLFCIVWLPSNTQSMGSLFILPSAWQVAARTETAPAGTTGYQLQVRGFADGTGALLDAWVDAPTTASH